MATCTTKGLWSINSLSRGQPFFRFREGSKIVGMKAYRGMNEETNLQQPAIAVPPGDPPLALMARVKPHGAPPPANLKTRFDIDADSGGDVAPNSGGMSVSRSWDDLPPFSIPRRLRRAYSTRNFRGANGGPDCRIWSHPVPAGFAPAATSAVAFAANLVLRVDGPGHGLVEPANTMPQADYESAIVGTRVNWTIDEPPPAQQPAPPGAVSPAPAAPTAPPLGQQP